MQVLSAQQMVVLALPRYRTRDVLSLVAAWAVRGALRVVDGGNLFNVLVVCRMIRRETSQVDSIMERIYVSRAFTCFQMSAMLCDLPALQTPLLVIDPLHTFYDESVDDQQSRRLLDKCMAYLKRQSRFAPVLLAAFPSPKAGKRSFLLETLLKEADSVWQSEPQAARAMQPMLWE